MRKTHPPRVTRSDGLRLFHADSPARYRRRRLIFLAIWLLTGAALVWPLFGLAARVPRFIGLPGPLAWVIGCLVVVFLALLWLYHSDQEPNEHRSD